MLESYVIFGAMFWKMRYWLIPCILVLLAYALYEAIEDKWSKREK